MSYKTVLTIQTDAVADAAAREAARRIAHATDGHLEVLCLGIDRTQPGFYYAGANALILQENMAQARADADALEAHNVEVLTGADQNWSTTSVSVSAGGLTGLVAQYARFADLVVLPKPYGKDRGLEAESIVEAALFGGHAPVLIVPDDAEWSGEIGQAVAAWNDSDEALAAIRAALPLLKAADGVDIAVVDPPRHAAERADPGAPLAQMLSRHGIRAQVSVLARSLPRVSDILARHCRDRDADLLVMGAYGHSRFRESILGGATRNMLEAAELPVLLAH